MKKRAEAKKKFAQNMKNSIGAEVLTGTGNQPTPVIAGRQERVKCDLQAKAISTVLADNLSVTGAPSEQASLCSGCGGEGNG
ncbi:hypothetical protein FCM35_KLT15492 [Carex littledalei]|uniref:Uncharacterized protein n=1 Tax=Carex littledalei TaxID=544730 RepID=A0A833RIF5_9POAL|nr:hypothetical protein FCM35_KLT15492 [Carex littledalei]